LCHALAGDLGKQGTSATRLREIVWARKRERVCRKGKKKKKKKKGFLFGGVKSKKRAIGKNAIEPGAAFWGLVG